MSNQQWQNWCSSAKCNICSISILSKWSFQPFSTTLQFFKIVYADKTMHHMTHDEKHDKQCNCEQWQRQRMSHKVCSSSDATHTLHGTVMTITTDPMGHTVHNMSLTWISHEYAGQTPRSWILRAVYRYTLISLRSSHWLALDRYKHNERITWSHQCKRSFH